MILKKRRLKHGTCKPMRYTGAELDTIRILGKVVAGQYRVV